ncbi:unnamed protein product [Phaeothamnion confervicola]
MISERPTAGKRTERSPCKKVMVGQQAQPFPAMAASTTGVNVPGLRFVKDFISEEEEAALLAEIGGAVWRGEIRRRVQHYGAAFDYDKLAADVTAKVPPLPDCCREVIERMETGGFVPESPDQLTVNEYVAGRGIGPHVDTHSSFGGTICSLSLGSGVAMEFCASDGARQCLYLARRSLLVIQGEARYAWTHAIPGRKTDVIDGGTARVPRSTRVSLTFRTVMKPTGAPCCCEWPLRCDSRLKPLWRAAVGASPLEIAHVHNVYDYAGTAAASAVAAAATTAPIAKAAAGGEQNGAAKASAATMTLLRRLPATALVLDVACGRESLSRHRDDCIFVGCDRSAVMLAARRQDSRVARGMANSTASNGGLAGENENDAGNSDANDCASGGGGGFSGANGDSTSNGDSIGNGNRGSSSGGTAGGSGNISGGNQGGSSSSGGEGGSSSAGEGRSSSGCSRDFTGGEAFVADALHLPFRRGSVDVTLCLGMLQHVSTEKRRFQALLELAKATRIGGFVGVTVSDPGVDVSVLVAPSFFPRSE